MKIVVAGSHGLIGSALVRRAESEGHEVLRLVRGEAGPNEAPWDPMAGQLDPSVLAGADAVVNLAGAGIGDRRWSPSYQQLIRASRINGTTTLARAIASLSASQPPPVFLNGSAIGYYGRERGEEELDETSTSGSDFLAHLCVEWEAATGPVLAVGARVVLARSGLVLSAAGGVLARQLPLFRLGLGGRLGAGTQYQSWITRHDHVSALLHCLRTASLNGPVNLVAPAPVTNAELAHALGSHLHRPTRLAVPSSVLRLALGREMADETVLAGQRVAPSRLRQSGFVFAHPELSPALEAALADRTV